MTGRTLRWTAFLLTAVVLLGLLPATPALGAGVSVPSMELLTWGRQDSGLFGFDTRGDIDLLFDGGYKFAARVLFGFSSSTLEEAAFLDTLALTFTSAGITLRELFGLPLDLTYFVGQAATFCSGDVFPERFGMAPLASRYHTFLHFPESDTAYQGIYSPTGTGLHVDFAPNQQRSLVSLYLYQDSLVDADGDPDTYDGRGRFSTDLRGVLNFNRIRLEAFLGASYPVPDGSFGYYRGGLLFYAAEQSVEFLAQVGIPRWNPSGEAIDINLFYLFVEPRVRFGAFAVVPSLFWRPGAYQQRDTGEQAIDANLDLQVGKPGQWPVAGGLEGNVIYQTERSGAPVNEILFKVSPYVQFLTAGVSWELRLTANLLPFVASDLLEAFVAVSARF